MLLDCTNGGIVGDHIWLQLGLHVELLKMT